jgi:hypothetical protein
MALYGTEAAMSNEEIRNRIRNFHDTRSRQIYYTRANTTTHYPTIDQHRSTTMNEYVIFTVCGLLVIAASLISIWTNDEASEQLMADHWWWQLPL